MREYPAGVKLIVTRARSLDSWYSNSNKCQIQRCMSDRQQPGVNTHSRSAG